jgi:hypothetical protein
MGPSRARGGGLDERREAAKGVLRQGSIRPSAAALWEPSGKTTQGTRRRTEPTGMTAARQARSRKARGSSSSCGLRLPAALAAKPVAGYRGLTSVQRASLLDIARDTWKSYGGDIDPATNLPMDNVTFAAGPATPTGYGRYTSAANIGVYPWAVVAARDPGLISEQQARQAYANIQALDNPLDDRAIQRDFARDPVSWAAHAYLSIETMSLR